MKKGFRRFCLMALAVVVGVVAVDFALGQFMDRVLPIMSNEGDAKKVYHTFYELDTPIVIAGSSRASHHYVSSMIADSLGQSVYNAGLDGRFMSYNYCAINSILDRYTPKTIVLDISPNWLYGKGIDNMDDLIVHYRRNKWASEVIKKNLSFNEYAKMNINLYRYASMLRHFIVRLCFGNMNEEVDKLCGYRPLMPKILESPLKLDNLEAEIDSLNQGNVDMFRSTLERVKSKGVRVIVVESPAYQIRPKNDRSAQMMKKICQEDGVEFYDNSQLDQFLQHPEYFKDATHLNDNGARVYTELFLQQIVCK